MFQKLHILEGAFWNLAHKKKTKKTKFDYQMLNITELSDKMLIHSCTGNSGSVL